MFHPNAFRRFAQFSDSYEPPTQIGRFHLQQPPETVGPSGYAAYVADDMVVHVFERNDGPGWAATLALPGGEQEALAQDLNLERVMNTVMMDPRIAPES